METIGIVLSVSKDRVEEFERGFRVFATGEGHHEHDNHPGFEAWNKKADEHQIADALAFGGETIITLETGGGSAR